MNKFIYKPNLSLREIRDKNIESKTPLWMIDYGVDDISCLLMTVRAEKRLKEAGICKISVLQKKSIAELKSIPGFGNKSASEVADVMYSKGYWS